MRGPLKGCDLASVSSPKEIYYGRVTGPYREQYTARSYAPVRRNDLSRVGPWSKGSLRGSGGPGHYQSSQLDKEQRRSAHSRREWFLGGIFRRSCRRSAVSLLYRRTGRGGLQTRPSCPRIGYARISRVQLFGTRSEQLPMARCRISPAAIQ